MRTHSQRRGPIRGAIVFLALATAVVGACAQRDAAPPASAATTSSAPAGTSGAASADAPSSFPVTTSGDTLSDSALISRADRGRLMGSESAPIWVLVISDFQCPYCKQWHDSSSAAVKRDYVDAGRVRMAYLNLPLPQHPHARAESEASLCAGAQGKFWPYADGLFAQQAAIARLPSVEPLLDSLARANALDLAEFARCRRSNAIRALVDSDVQQATRANIRSTPSFLIGDFLVEGASPYADFRRAIDTALVVAKNKRAR